MTLLDKVGIHQDSFGDSQGRVEELAAETRRLAARIADASALVISIGKQAYYTQIDLDQSKAYAYAKEVMSMNALAADAQEGISAFLEKRAPCWTGK